MVCEFLDSFLKINLGYHQIWMWSLPLS
jgi:hypothetical protein